MLKPTILLSLGLLLAAPAFADPLKPLEPWVREAPPGMMMLGGYVRLHNPGAKEIRILGAESSAFGAIELHKTEIVAGTAKMIQQDALAIPPGAEISLAPGGYHLMLMQPKKPLKAGDSVDITLKLDGDATQAVRFEVRKVTGSTPEDHSHHHHH
ncbi:MAG: copper chaperone PCu(A)C [Thiotrichales bacterium]